MADIIETDPSLPLQAAHVAALESDTGLQALFPGGSVTVFDRVSENTFPFIRVGEDKVIPLDGECGSDSEVFSTVRIYSRGVGKVEAKQLAARVRFLLTKNNPAFSVSGFKIVIGYCTSIESIEHEDGLTTQMAIDFKYRLQPIAP